MGLKNKNSKLLRFTRKKISDSHKKIDKSYLCNRVFSEEHKRNISKSKKGKSVGVGKKLTEKHKKSISEGFKPKFNEVELTEIVEMYNKKISLRKIALKYNSNHITIKRYIESEIIKIEKP
jgi:DNA invertase Pin-like site-specific DNA recombinase